MPQSSTKLVQKWRSNENKTTLEANLYETLAGITRHVTMSANKSPGS